MSFDPTHDHRCHAEKPMCDLCDAVPADRVIQLEGLEVVDLRTGRIGIDIMELNLCSECTWEGDADDRRPE